MIEFERTADRTIRDDDENILIKEGKKYTTSGLHSNGTITVFGIGDFGVEDFSDEKLIKRKKS